MREGFMMAAIKKNPCKVYDGTAQGLGRSVVC